MPLFEIKNKKAKKVNTKEFKNELELHQLIDKNLEEIFGVRFIKDEHITDKHGRIETLGIDESNRPIVIEYKKTKEKGQLVQANRYMTWIKQNPDSFELLARKNIKNLTDEIDFSNPRILCFAQEYSIDDKCLALSLGAELWKYRYYENDTLVISREEEPEQLITTKNKGFTIEKISREPRIAKTVDQHLNGANKELIDLFTRIDSEIKNISSEVERYTTNAEIIYKTSRNFVYLSVQNKNNCLRLLLRTSDDNLVDEKKLTKKIPKTHGYGNITRQLHLFPKDEKSEKFSIEYIMSLINQSYASTQ
jgi:predicted transport protein